MNHHSTGPDHFPVLFRVALDLFRRPSPSGREDLVRAYIVEHLENCGFTVSIDAAGNVLAERGRPDPRYPLLSFHMDCISSEISSVSPFAAPTDAAQHHSTRRSTAKSALLPPDALEITRGWLHSKGKFVLGGDDKCGAAIALALATMTDMPLKIVASVQEEVGCIGIEQVDPQFFEDVAYALVLDRRGANHLIVSIAGQLLCQGAFAAAMMRAAADVGLLVYAMEGALSDALTLSHSIPNVVNLSVGYYAPHSVKERVSLADLWHAYQWVHEALNSLPRTLPDLNALSAQQMMREAFLCPHCQKLTINSIELPEDLQGFICHCAE